MDTTRQSLQIQFTKPADKNTRFKAIQLIEMPLSKDQTESLNTIFRRLSHESNEKHYLEVIRYDKNIILADTKSVDKWTIFTNGKIIKYP